MRLVQARESGPAINERGVRLAGGTAVLTVGDELKQKELADPLGEVYSAQNAFQTSSRH